MIRLGKTELKYGLMLAPMAGVTDDSFRTICKHFGVEYMVTEMISAKGIHFGDKKTDTLARIDNAQRPVAIQIFGSDPNIMAESAQTLYYRYHPDAIDINMGCPVHKIVSCGEGSALMRTPQLAKAIISSVVDAVPEIPVTVKFRTGWDENSKNAPAFADMAQLAGAAAICIHGRTREQMYAPPIDFETIAAVKKSVSIPVFANGGIMSADDALHMIDMTACDGLAIGRGACGNPWIFREIIAALQGQQSAYQKPTTSERIHMAITHAEMLSKAKGIHIGTAEARKHIAWYLKGIPKAASIRNAINTAVHPDEMKAILTTLLNT